ncbi:outer membrane protein [Aestuariivirga sp.]|uniref:outer membrane protein n=1 Tax=Aestuariivirga sp. TaxID=2650926 RepID=UPI0037848D6D
MTVADADTANIGNPVAATVLAQGFSLTNSSTGVYGGASYASAEVDSAKAEALAIALGGLPQIGEFSATGGGITPEIHLRLDHQTESNWIFGAEVNFSMAEGGEGSSAELVIDPYDAGGAGPDTVTIVRGFDTETNALFSARLRLGYAMGDYMVYGTGGLAYADFSATLTTTGTYLGAEASESRTESGEAFGGVIGGGVSTFVADNATVSLEALYYNFDDEIDFDGTNEGMSVTLDDAFSLMAKFSIRTN